MNMADPPDVLYILRPGEMYGDHQVHQIENVSCDPQLFLLCVLENVLRFCLWSSSLALDMFPAAAAALVSVSFSLNPSLLSLSLSQYLSFTPLCLLLSRFALPPRPACPSSLSRALVRYV